METSQYLLARSLVAQVESNWKLILSKLSRWKNLYRCVDLLVTLACHSRTPIRYYSNVYQCIFTSGRRCKLRYCLVFLGGDRRRTTTAPAISMAAMIVANAMLNPVFVSVPPEDAADGSFSAEAVAANANVATVNPCHVPAATVITTAPKNTATSTTIRYSTSPDPRSTASSSTPPAPNPASFDIPITHANQVTAGTVISYNATKGERIIYGGDLVLSQSTFTYYHNTNGVYTNEVNFTVSSPDGSTVEMPGLPYNVQANGIVVSMDSSQYKSTGSSFPMMIDVYNSNLAAGSYNIHIVTNRTTEGADAYEYDGFLTVNVVD
jgi:hypothetical protein